jgi:hypothetical protein
MVLPITVDSGWNGSATLGAAVASLIWPQVNDALAATDKFSVTLPFKFDPILQRAVVEKRLMDADVKALVATPTVQTARPILDKLDFDQPAMLVDISLLDVRVGGTKKDPTVQLQISGKLYQEGGGAPVKTVIVTSDPANGRSNRERIQRAADQDFQEMARQFVEAPRDLALTDLQLPEAPAAAAPAPNPAPAVTPVVPPAVTMPPAQVQVLPPNSLTPEVGKPFVPQLPAGQPPLGLSIPGEQGVGNAR